MVKADQRHLYLQVIERLKKDIETGIFKENERFPSEFELARNTWVSVVQHFEKHFVCWKRKKSSSENMVLGRLLIQNHYLHQALNSYQVFPP